MGILDLAKDIFKAGKDTEKVLRKGAGKAEEFIKDKSVRAELAAGELLKSGAEKAEKKAKSAVKTGLAHAGSAIAKAGAVVLAVAIAVNVANMMAPEQPEEDELAAVLNPAYVVEETVDMTPVEQTEEPGTSDEDERRNRRFSISGILAYIGGCAVSMLSGLTHLFLPAATDMMTLMLFKILGWLVFAAAIFAAVIIGLKKVFPDVPLKQLLRKNNVLAIILFIVCVFALCEAAQYYLSDYIIYIKLLAYAAGLAFVYMQYEKLKRGFLDKLKLG